MTMDTIRAAILQAKTLAHDNPAEELSAAYWGCDTMNLARIRFLLNEAEKAALATITAIQNAQRVVGSFDAIHQAAE